MFFSFQNEETERGHETAGEQDRLEKSSPNVYGRVVRP